MVKELKEKDEASRSSEVSKHIYHNAKCVDGMHGQYYGSQSYYPQGYGLVQHQTFSQGQAQPPFAWQQQAYQPYQQAPQYPLESVVVSSPLQPEQQQSSQQQQAKLDNTHENQAVNSILPSRGHIFAITGGSNQEHESKRAKRDFERRVHTASPRLPLNRPEWFLLLITFDENDFQLRD